MPAPAVQRRSSTRRSNPHGFPALYRVALDGARRGALADALPRIDGGVGTRRDLLRSAGDAAQRRPVQRSLRARSRADGRVRQLTTEARLLDPDLSPDGTTLVCVQNGPGQRDLVLVRLPPTRRGIRTAGSRSSSAEPIDHDADRRTGDAIRRAASGRPTAARSRSSVIASARMPEIVVVDVATQGVARRSRRRRTRASSRRPGGPTAARSSPRVAPDDETFNLVELPLDGSARAPADAHDRRRDVAGRFAGRTRRSSSSATPTRRIRPVLDAVSAPRGDGRLQPHRISRCACGRTARARRSRRAPAGQSHAARPAYSPLADAEADIVDAGRRDRQQSGARRRRRSAATTCSAITPTRRRRPGSCRARRARRRPTRRRPTGRSPTSTTAGGRRLFVSASERHIVLRRPGDRRRHADRGDAARTAVRGRHRLPDPARARSSTRRGCRWSARSTDYTLRGRRRSRAIARRSARRGKRSRRTPTAIRSAAKDGIAAGATAEARAAARSARSPTRRRSTGDRARLSAGRSRRIMSSRFALAGGASTGDATRRPHVPARRRRRPATASPTSAAARSACCAASAPNTFAGSHVALAQRRLPLADRAAAARHRHLAAVPAHAARRRVRRRRPRVDAHVSIAARSRSSAGARALRRRRRRLLRCRSPSRVGAAWGHDGSGRSSRRRRPSTSASAKRSSESR